VRDEAARKAEIGYRIDRQYWGMGYATEAADRVLEFGFDRLQMKRIFAHVMFENVGSVRELEKIGMRQEGILRKDAYFHDRFWDVCIYGILVSDWLREG
jgi:ribosomal-protein-alanine N-acetyltransferase